MNGFDAIARANPDYVDALYRQYRRDPRAVDEGWALVFAGYEFALRGDARPAGQAQPIGDLVHSYRLLGHLVADLDPLGGSPRSHPLLRLADLGVRESDLDRPVPADAFPGLERATLRDLVGGLAATYAGTLGVEYLGIPDKARRDWLRERMEPTRNRPALEPADRVAILERLMAAETFEQFLHAKYVGQKRFSLEGGEALIPLLDTIVEEAARLEVNELVMGMPHRGRLNVLAHTLRKPYELILAEFEGAALPPEIEGDGDVKYHLGYAHDHRTGAGRTIHLSLSPNPSHLEWVNPVVEGIVRAKQAYRGDRARKRVVPVLLHGDAAFMGQGVVYETLAMSELPAFTTGGTIHVVVNNQIGFTTAPADYLFTRYPTGPANVIHAPVFHVNADDPEAAVQAARLAVGYRQAFGADVFIDFVCYRRHGHNELDDPTLTQPVLYEQIRNHPSAAELYRKRLAEGGLVDERHLAGRRTALRQTLEQALAAARRDRPQAQVFAFGGVWAGLARADDDWSADTAVPAERLRAIAGALKRLPPDFTPHPRLRKSLDERYERVERGEGLDWGTAEMLAYGSLLLEGVPVRLSGQDSVRGTFSHRHAALFDAEDGHAWVPLNHLAESQARIEAVNSLLSEAAVLGFEYGMSSADPRRLVVWEAQFGDFANSAQVIIDQFIASGESKWQRMSGITLLLPHGYEGQGPEHSSARLERFLQLAAERNMQVIYPTTPGQLFHALRRQVHRPFRKPLVVMTPKSLLRHPRSVSSLDELAGGSFRAVLDDVTADDAGAVRRVLVCTGKLYFPLDEARRAGGRRDVAIVRVEELYPFPETALREALARYDDAAEVCWVQEEPANQGAWSFVRPRLASILEPRSLRYVGREEAASPATGSYQLHQQEEAAILRAAVGDGDAAAGTPARPTPANGGQATG